MIVRSVNARAKMSGIQVGMVVADGKAVLPALQVFDDDPDKAGQLLYNLADWCIRYTPVVAVDPPDGLVFDISGCAHLWGGEHAYLNDIVIKLRTFGYDVRSAMADTIGAAWAIARFGKSMPILEPGKQADALLSLPPAALRLDPEILDKMQRLGLYTIQSFIGIPHSALRRRFGQQLLTRLDQALGKEATPIQPVRPIEPYQERLPSAEPIITAKGIEIALQVLLEQLCGRLTRESKGLRSAVFRCYRSDGLVKELQIGTNRASRNIEHLYKLFDLKIPTLDPGPGIELFLLEASLVEDLSPKQETLWNFTGQEDTEAVAELLDCIAAKMGAHTIHRYLPDEHYWPERSIKQAVSLQEKPTTVWPVDRPRPIHLLPQPEPIEVTVQLPDYPPMHFHYKGRLHRVRKADGPERIEAEWWIEDGLHRDYYCLEDETGARYWVFRLGHYATGEPKWYLHGFFA